MPKRNSLWANIDWVTVSLFLILVVLGWINIYASVYSEEHRSILDISQRYGKQLIWIGAALLIAFVILIVESNFYVISSYIIYGAIILLLLLVLLLGKEVNGARSWFMIGSFGFQPSEFAKFATALALARFMSSYGFKLQKPKSLFIVSAIVALPALFIVLQNDTGSALVYFAFVLVLYREGLSGVVLFFGTLVAVLFVFSLIISSLTLILLLLGAALAVFLVSSTKKNQFFRVFILFAVCIMPLLLVNLALQNKYEISSVVIAGSLLAGIIVLIDSYRKRFTSYAVVAVVYIGSVLFSLTVDYAFENMLGEHHRDRINEYLGIVSDPLGSGYNVNQSKIAIGSGGFLGKGFLNGTQTKFDFVPEQTTDFIFCTIGEEWGFVGSFFFISLFLLLLTRLVVLAERQRSSFSRIYGYSVAVILFFHFAANVGMTIGVLPVIGIPLPFFSYGGSSLWSFTILLFIFVRLDASRHEKF